MRSTVFYFLLFLSITSAAQTAEQRQQYDLLVKDAKKAFEEKDFDQAAHKYSKAFKAFGDKGFHEDRYQAAISWTHVNQPDSAFKHLFRLAEKTEYLDYHKLKTTEVFLSLHKHPKWEKLMLYLNPRNEVYNDSLAKILETVYYEDQVYRKQIDETTNKYGRDSKEVDELWDKIEKSDSLNLQKVQKVLDKYGWLSNIEVGKDGNSAIWLVIQHAPLPVQLKYLPAMKEAVEKGKATKINLAYLEDRILMRQGKKQLYGTQSRLNKETGYYDLWEVEDPENLNKRRAEIGLPPMNK